MICEWVETAYKVVSHLRWILVTWMRDGLAEFAGNVVTQEIDVSLAGLF